MSAPAGADRNLLFGLLAWQMDFIDRDTLLAALHAWALDKGRPLGQILHEQGKLIPERRQLLKAMVQEHLRAHGNDPQQSLAALSSVSAVRQDLQQIADQDVQASLALVSSAAAPSTGGTASYHADDVAASAESSRVADATAPVRRYRILRPHARGGLGEVFVAEDTELHREVALKEIRPEHAADQRSRGRFVLEAEITGGLEHPGIVPIYGLGQYADGRPFYAMRFIKGDNLKEAIQRFHGAEGPQRDPGERNVAFRELLGRFVDVCNAIAYAHSRGILHRDLKPGNVMLGKYGETLVVDWGLAKPVGKAEGLPESGEATLRPSSADSDPIATRMGTAVGTPAFMSPEQAVGRLDLLGPASDLYSLGATLYAVLTGQAPFAGNTAEVLRRVQRGEFAPPRQVQANVPAALEAVCLKAMALQPQDRYRTALALAEDVEHWLADEPVSAWPEPVTVRLGRWARRHKPLVSGVAAALLVGLLAVGVGGYWYEQEQSRRALERERTTLEVEQSLQQARNARQKLQDQLRQPGGVFLLLNHPADWHGQLQAAQSLVKQARAQAQAAEGLLDGPLGPEVRELEQLLRSDEVDYQLAVALEKVRLDKAAWVEGKFDNAGAVRAYPKAFRQAALAMPEGEVGALAGRIQQSPIREQLLAALDDWALAASFARQPQLVERLLAVARHADPDPWRQQLRALQVWNNPRELDKLIRALPQGPKAGPFPARLSPQLLYLVGDLLRDKGKAKEAWLRQAQAAYPADFWLNLQLGTVLLKKQPEAALGFYRVALAVRPQSTAAHNNLGTALAAQKDYAGAIRHYRRALMLDPNFAYAHNNLGTALHAQKDYAGAITHYQQALQLDPNLAQAHHNLGTALQNKKDYAGAITHYQQALQLNPNDVLAHLNWGTALNAQKDYAGANTHFQQALKLDPNNAKAHHNWGAALAAQKDYAGAIRHYQQALQLDPNNAYAHYNWGLALHAEKDYAGAIRHYQQALALDPNDAQAHYNWGLALYAQKDYTGAIGHCTKALELDPNYALAHHNWGTALHAQKDYAGAITHYQQALQLDPNLALAHNGWGAALAKQKDYVGAITHHRQAIKLDPNYAPAHGALGRALLAQGEFTTAQQATQQALKLLPPGLPLRGTVQKQLQRCQQLLQLEQRAVAVLQGQAPPTSPAEQLQLAQFCRQYRRYQSAARLYTAALTAQPALAENLAQGHRYHAAGAAALAAAGQGLDADQLPAKDQAELRRQALDWLRADLKRLTQTVASYQAASEEGHRPPASPLEKLTGPVQKPGPADLLRVCDRLQRWQADPDLAGLRADQALAKLPPQEQTEWHKFWAAAQSLEKQAQGSFTERQLSGNLTAPQHEQVHELPLQADTTYVFDLESTAFAPLLRLEDNQGSKLAETGDMEPGTIPAGRLVFTPRKGATYRLVATSFRQRGTGAYVLRVRTWAGRR